MTGKRRQPQGVPNTLPRVALVNMTNIAECRHMALSLQDAGMLARWYTGIYVQPSRGGVVSRLLPAVKRRGELAIDSSRVHTISSWEWLRLLMVRLPVLNGAWKRALGRFLTRRFGLAVARHLVDHPVDVVVSTNFAALEAFVAAKSIGAQTVLSQRTQPPDVVRRTIVRELAQRNITRNRFLEPGFAQQVARGMAEISMADYLLCPSMSVQAALKADQLLDSRLVFLPFGVDLARFDRLEARARSRGFVILYVGRVGYLKGVPYLLEAFAELDWPDARLVLVGKFDGISGNTLRDMARVAHYDWLPPVRLIEHYSSADVFVLPSLAEGSALVSYEAMAAGLPVIATTASGTLVRDGVDGFLIPPADVGALKDRLDRLYRDRALAELMGARARKQIQAFTWERYRQDFGTIIADRWRSYCEAQHTECGEEWTGL